MYKIMLIEDDFSLAEAMKNQIEAWGNEVFCVKDFKNITEEFKALNPQLVLLDIMLPFKDGYFWCNEIRKISSVPIIFISSANDNMNIVMAVNLGGDDFIAKPVDPAVLTAKIGAILRRTYEFTTDTKVVEFCGITLNLSDNSVTIGGKNVDFTKNEFRILTTLIENKGKIVSRDTLMIKLWQDDCYVEENTLTVNVGRLRKKLMQNGICDLIVTKPGIGYIIK